MWQLFLDESGECSFSSSSQYKHFLITILSINAVDITKLKRRLQRAFASFIKSGWDKRRELKAAEVYKNRKFGPKSITDILQVMIPIESLRISYLVVRKEGITYPSFRSASYGIGYNYFTGTLLSELVFTDNMHELQLIYDRRNKESHPNKHFREYLETKIYGTALEQNIDVNMTIQGDDSQKSYGLRGLDYFCWSIFRKFESGDDSYYRLFKHKLLRKREWYI